MNKNDIQRKSFDDGEENSERKDDDIQRSGKDGRLATSLSSGGEYFE